MSHTDTRQLSEAEQRRTDGAVSRRPARLSAALSLAVAAIAVSLVEPAAMVGTFVTAAGFVITNEGVHRIRTERRLIGSGGLLVGTAVVLGGIGLAVASVAKLPALIEVGLGVVGVVCLGLGTLPLRGSGSRFLVKLGAALVLLTIVAGGLFQDAGAVPLLVSCAALVGSWDAAENSINVGEQLGRETKTWPIEAAHLGGTALVGVVAVGAGLVVRDLGTPGLPLHSLAFLLVALVFLTLALHD